MCDCILHRCGLIGEKYTLNAVLDHIGRMLSRVGAYQSSERQTGVASASEYVVRDGHILTMDDKLGDLVGDIHIKDGAIVAIGENLSAPRAVVIEGKGMIVMPGFVDTHWHLWNTALRQVMRADDPQLGYFPSTLRLGPQCTPVDAYCNVRLGVAEALLSGITTVHNWSHNTVTPAHADAELQALADSRIRARFSYGWGQGAPLNQMMNLSDLDRVKREWSGRNGMLSIGACLRTPGPSPRGQLPLDVLRSEVEGVRRIGLPITMHTGPKNLLGLLEQVNCLGPDVLLVHPQGLSAVERALVASTKTLYSISPVIEMSFSAVRNGTIFYRELEDLKVQMGLSIDSSSSTNADFFNVMRALAWSDWNRTGAPLKLTPRRLVELATIEGARLLGLADVTGSLRSGKRADLILIRTGDLNLAPVGDPYYAMVFFGLPSNIDTVMVDGRILCQSGRLTGLDAAKVVREARESTEAVVARSKAA